jgi:hypothetical protein
MGRCLSLLALGPPLVSLTGSNRSALFDVLHVLAANPDTLPARVRNISRDGAGVLGTNAEGVAQV